MAVHSTLNPLSMTEEAANRRKKPRLSLPFPVTVRGVDSSGKVFALDTVLENISAGGIYIRLRNRLELGTTLRLLVRFSISPSEPQAARVAAHGKVIRIEEQPHGVYGVAIGLTHYRFL